MLGFESRAHRGTVDHGKFWTTLFAGAVMVAHFIHNPMPVATVITVGSMLFGRAMWGRFLESKTVEVKETVLEHRFVGGVPAESNPPVLNAGLFE